MLFIQRDDIIVAAEKALLTTLFSVDLVETKLMTHPIEINFSHKFTVRSAAWLSLTELVFTSSSSEKL